MVGMPYVLNTFVKYHPEWNKIINIPKQCKLHSFLGRKGEFTAQEFF